MGAKNETAIIGGAIEAQALASLRFDFNEPAIGAALWKAVQERIGRSVSSGTVYQALTRLVEKKLVIESVTKKGRPARTYEINSNGMNVLDTYLDSLMPKKTVEMADNHH